MSNEKPETLFAFRSDDIGKMVFLSDPDEMGVGFKWEIVLICARCVSMVLRAA